MKRPVELKAINAASAQDFAEIFAAVCGAPAWLTLFATARPFASWDHLCEEATRCWFALDEAAWLAAFAHHPAIGASQAEISQGRSAAAAAQSNREQHGMALATPEQRQEFTELNTVYRERFGFVFLICARKRSASDMLSELKRRLPNPRATELTNAAHEQAQIMELRLRELQERSS